MREIKNTVPQRPVSGGLGRTLFFTFLLLALVPLSIVSYISYNNATKSLHQEAINDLKAAMKYKRQFIKQYFSSMTIDISLQAEFIYNIKMLRAFTATLKESGIPVKEFITTPEWKLINTKAGDVLRSFQKAHGYQGIYLINITGSILYSASEKHLGSNIFMKEYASKTLGDACRATLKTGEPVLSDYGYHGGRNKTLSLFLAKAVEDEETGQKIGVLVFELPYTHLDTFIQTHFGLGESGETYLVGTDLLIRSNLRFSKESTILQTKIDTKLLRHWRGEHMIWHELQRHVPDATLPAPQSTEEMLYLNYQGVPVLGMYSTLDFLGELGFHWALVAEVNEKEAFASAIALKKIVTTLLLFTSAIVLSLAWFILRRLVAPLRHLTHWAGQVAEGDLTLIDIKAPANEIGQLNSIFRETVKSLGQAEKENQRYNWLRAGQLELDDRLRGDPPLNELAQKIITYISKYIGAQVGTIYVNDKETLRLLAGYAYRRGKNFVEHFRIGEGMVGQAALEKKSIIVTDVPDDYICISSSLGQKKPNNIILVPFVYNDEVKAVLEIGSFASFTELQISFVEGISEKLAVTINGAQARNQLQEALTVTTEQADILQSQQEELQAANEELEEQTQRLRASEEELQTNQNQLVATNEQLEEKNSSLNRQKQKIEEANKALTLSRIEIERKAEEVARASKCKSEFLANMSHELRTPLNSLLLLAQTLGSNKKGNLNEDDIESVGVIYNSGNELLALINDILDLSKIEAGHMTLNRDRLSITDLLAEIKNTFRHLAAKKGLTLHFDITKDTPPIIESDRQRLDQVLKNLLSNAIKFTDNGSITVSVSPVRSDAAPLRTDLRPENAIAIAVEDSGVGIPEEKQKIIFNAFQQADGGTSRKYGGTGLGLSISRELADLLDGEIQLRSEEGRGSTFTIFLPLVPLERKNDDAQSRAQCDRESISSCSGSVERRSCTLTHPPATQHIDDDRHDLKEGDLIVLVIEDDSRFAKLLAGQCHEKGLKCLAAPTGEEGLLMAMVHQPTAIILDLKLPGINGWQVLDCLKEQIGTRHIPVHIMSVDDAGQDARRRGAVEALRKPVNQERLEIAFLNIQETARQNIKNLLIAGQDARQRKDIVSLIGENDVHSEEAGSGREALDKFRAGHYDCLITGLDFADMSGLIMLQQLQDAGAADSLPVIIYTDKKLSWEETAELRQYADSIIIKGVMSEERLLDESALFLHRTISSLPELKRRMIRNLHEDKAVFQGKRVLIVDDDMRNTFALAKVLQDKGMKTVKAEDGGRALEVLEREQEENFDLVLMDIMMPVMDGYETIKQIRKRRCFKKLPIIALTAKAMKDDRSRCLAAGANDYLAKPVDTERLLALLRLWLYC